MTKAQSIKNLALYHYQSCPYCAVTRSAIDNKNVAVERRDIQQSREHRNTLTRQGGKPQVPCLRIERDNGKVEWLYESAEIIQFINRHTTTQTQAA